MYWDQLGQPVCEVFKATKESEETSSTVIWVLKVKPEQMVVQRHTVRKVPRETWDGLVHLELMELKVAIY